MSFASINMSFMSLCEGLDMRLIWKFCTLPSLRCESVAQGRVSLWHSTIGSVACENNYHVLTSSFSLGGGWLEVRCHGDWPNLPVGVRVGVCARNNGTLLPASHQFPRMTADWITRSRSARDAAVTRKQQNHWHEYNHREETKKRLFISSHSDSFTHTRVTGSAQNIPDL